MPRARLDEADLQAMLARGGARVVGSHGGMPKLTSPPKVTAARRPDRYRSETERRFAAVLDTWQHRRKIDAWFYEPMRGLYLAPKTSYTPDFLTKTMEAFTFYEVKGAHIYAKDRQKLKQAAAIYWCFTFVLAQWKEAAWHFMQIPAA